MHFDIENSNKLEPHLQRMVDHGVNGLDIMHGELKNLMLVADAQFEEAQRIEEEVYQEFLTKKEIDAILNNKDLWLTTNEVADRLRKKAKVVASHMEELLEESDGTT